MNEKSNKYAMAALKDRRARLAGEVHALKAQADAKLRQIETLDATMRIFDPDFDPASLPKKRVYERVPLFSRGELGRAILGVLREANGTPLSGQEIAAGVMVKLETPPEARAAIATRVRSGMTYLKHHHRSIIRTGSRLEARWTLRDEPESTL